MHTEKVQIHLYCSAAEVEALIHLSPESPVRRCLCEERSDVILDDSSHVVGVICKKRECAH